MRLLDVSKLTMFLNNYKPLVTALSLLKQAELKFAQADERLKARSLICEVDVLKNFSCTNLFNNWNAKFPSGFGTVWTIPNR